MRMAMETARWARLASQSGLGVVIGLGLDAGDNDPDGVGVAGEPAHAVRTTPRRRDAARRFAFIGRRRWYCGLSRR
jgi:hypothetical protein